MLFRKQEDLQRLDLKSPKPAPAAADAATPAQTVGGASLPPVHPAIIDAVSQRAKVLLDSGRTPEWLFVCEVPGGLLHFKTAEGGPVTLIFSHPFGASDYLRTTRAAAKVSQFRVEALPELVRLWISSGAASATLDRCPRCPHALTIPLAGMARWTKGDFAKVWAQLRATRMISAETRIRSAMSHMSAKSFAAARADLEYVRDHFDCGVPYLHQMIGLMAGFECNEAAKAAAIERLKEFGPQFAGPLDFSVDLYSRAIVGLMANFAVLPAR